MPLRMYSAMPHVTSPACPACQFLTIAQLLTGDLLCGSTA